MIKIMQKSEKKAKKSNIALIHILQNMQKYAT